ncbi:hypothetical protein C0Q70_19054 [Pomacea canaliculata]|uniref:Pseudouridine synthase RsuA/RluA-like domain-containing protein n=2 Tax=Pomacea canaliculata TaxID=400727 RepID=A0A2T7NI91_POMCA|nr:hypothetical protein C0Q70_19054 [Pomacea canaliculata]
MDAEQEVQPAVDLMATLAETANNDSGILLSSINTVGDVSVNPLVVNQMSKRARKKMLRQEKQKALRKSKRPFTRNTNPGFSKDVFSETDYYFENGLRKVYPYYFAFGTYAKERWYGRTVQDVFQNEFRVDFPDDFRLSVEKGNLRVNGDIVGLDYKLTNGDLIEHHIHRHENPVLDTSIEIISDTPDLVVINKPASIPCHPCGKFRFNSIVFIMGKEFGYENLRNIYRLDRLTSGVLILGKTAKKTKELEDQVLHRHVYKEYVARVVGEFPEGEIEVDQPLGCISHKLTLWRVQSNGKPSRTTFQRLSYNGCSSVVKCIPHTGRTHQIRVHLQYLGYPIVNDPYYNSLAWGPERGKGGISDVSTEELCKRIMQEHNVGMWFEGENPLFHQAINTETDAGLNVLGKNITEDRDGTMHDEMHSAKSLEKLVNTSHSPDLTQSPEAKRQRLTVKAEETREKSQLENISVLVSESNVDKSTEEEKANKAARSGFDAARWVPDSGCRSCRLKYVDPKPSDLVMYLHALKYQGPDWNFCTSLPAWAQDDWESPKVEDST